MPAYLRSLTLKRWAESLGPYEDHTTVPADPISDLKTDGNVLSISLVEDDQSNLKRVAAAFACTRPDIRKLEFALVPHDALEAAGFRIEKVRGQSPDTSASDAYHFDLVSLTGVQLVKLAQVIINTGAIQAFWSEQEVKEAIRASVEQDFIDLNRLTTKIKNSL